MATPDVNFIRTSLPFFDQLPPEAQAELVAGIQISHVSAGQLLYNAGDKCLGLLLLRSGRLRVYLLSGEGREVTLYFIGLNETSMLAGSCILNTPALPVTVEAEVDSEVYIIPPMVYGHLIQLHPEAESYMSRTLMDSFSHTLKAVETVVFLTMEQRMALLILQQQSFEQSDRLHLTQEKMSRQLGTAREVVSRQLKKFADEGLVRTFRGGLEVLDSRGLEELVPESL